MSNKAPIQNVSEEAVFSFSGIVRLQATSLLNLMREEYMTWLESDASKVSMCFRSLKDEDDYCGFCAGSGPLSEKEHLARSLGMSVVECPICDEDCLVELNIDIVESL